MSKFVCSVCGYVYEGEAAPKECPICHAPAEKFNKVEETAITWADEHKVGVAEGLDEEVVAGLREVCGAFTGAVMVLGLKFGNTIGSDRAAKGKDYERVQLFAKRFKEELGSDTIICRELLGLSGPSDPDPAKRTKEYYQKRPCPETVAIASGLLGEFME